MLYDPIRSACELRKYFIATERDHFTYEAYEAMIEYYEEQEDDVEICTVSICGMFKEDEIDKIIEDYSIEIKSEEKKEDEVLAFLNDNTWARKTEKNKILYTEF
jgi:hypothetical protein